MPRLAQKFNFPGTVGLNQNTSQADGLVFCWPGTEPRAKSLLVGPGNLTLNNIIGKKNSLGFPVTGFNGTSSYITVPEYAGVDIAANGIVFMSAWYQPDTDNPGTDGNGGYIIMKGNRNSDNKDSYALLTEPSGVSTIVSSRIWNGSGLHGASVTLAGSAGPAYAGWPGGLAHHIFGGYDGSNWIVGVDGIIRNTTSDAVGPINTNEPISIGAFITGSTPSRYCTAGSIWDVRIYSKIPSRAILYAMYERPGELYNANRRAFWAIAAASLAPTFTNISPTTGVQATTVNATLTGTNFDGGHADVTISGTGVTVSNIVVVGPTSITCDFVIAGGATISTRTVTVTTDLGTSGTQNFSVTTTLVPAISSISPNNAYANASLPVTLTGVTLAGTQFDSGGSPVVNVPAGFTASSTVVNSAILVTFNLALSAGLAAGTYNISFTNTNGTSGNITFTVNNPTGGSGGGIDNVSITGGGLIFS